MAALAAMGPDRVVGCMLASRTLDCRIAEDVCYARVQRVLRVRLAICLNEQKHYSSLTLNPNP